MNSTSEDTERVKHRSTGLRIGFRGVSSQDIGDLLNIYKRSYEGLEEYAYTRNREIKSYIRWMLSRDRNGFIVAELAESRKVGFVMVDTNWLSPFERRKVGEIHELVVLPEFRNRGIGSMLVLKAFEYMSLKNRNVAELWVGYKNLSAQKFYKKLGFEERDHFGKWIRMTRVLHF
jgi:ribosomal protein S18 acetylase RimI-like enzyme